MNQKTHNSVGSCFFSRISMLAVFAVFAISAFAATTTVTSFTHSTGQYYTATETNKVGGYHQQKVHEDVNVIYSKSNSSLSLTRRTDAFHIYVRWFDYSTDQALSGLSTTGSTGDLYTGTMCGAIQTRTSSTSSSGFTATYNYNGTSHVYVGCDQSAYTDATKDAAFVEPTLSQRIVYDIRPASWIADTVDQTTGDDAWMEEYDIVAPSNATIYLGPQYAFVSSSSDDYVYPNYYYGKNNPTAMSTLSNWKWNGNSISSSDVTSGRFIKVSAPSNSATVASGDKTFELTYKVGSTTYHIAKFTVHYMKRSEVGPTTITDTTRLSNATMIARQDFNFGTTAGSLSDSDEEGVRYPYPLAVEESSFGFFSSSTDHIGSPNSDYKYYPYYNEYCFVNNGNGWYKGSVPSSATDAQKSAAAKNCIFKNHTGSLTDTDPTSGYAIYADGSKKPGTVFSLNFKAELCPGATMYFSAYVGELSGGDHAILDLIVLGVNTDGTEEVISTFTTGELTSECSTAWRRILYPLTFDSNIEYPSYRLRIVNKAKTTSGNDFFLDDVAIYLKPSPITPIQASSFNNCLEEGTTGAKVVLYTRIDFAKVSKKNNNNGTSSIYYRWEKGNYKTETTTPLVTADKATYLNTQTTYGEIIVPNTQAAVESNTTFSSKIIAATTDKSGFQIFDERYNALTAEANYAFVKETCSNDDGSTEERYVVYVATPVSIDPGQWYTCRITESTGANAFSANNKCSNVTAFQTAAGLHIASEKGMITETSEAVCANYSFELRVKIQYSAADYDTHTSSTKDAYYKAHWLFGTKATINANPDLYGYSFERIKQAIDNMVGQAPGHSTYTDEDKAIIKSLQQKGLLVLASELASEVYTVMPLGDEDSRSYTAFPVEKLDANAPSCFNPVTITLFFANTSAPKNTIIFVKSESEPQVPAFVSSRPRRVRIIEGTATKDVAIRLSDKSNEYKMGAISLYSTDDASYNSVVAYQANKTVVTGTGNVINFSNLGNLQANHSYTFKILYALQNQAGIEADCSYNADTKKAHDGEAYITFLIVPKLLTFTGDSVNAAWNNDYSWSFINGTDTTVTFAPLEETSVIFQSGDHILLNKTATAAYQEKANVVESNALPYITYDINYQPYTCDNVYVPAETALPGQTNIDVKGSWTFEMPVTPNKWVMSAMPVQGIVSGDIFIPASGESTTDVFAVKQMTQTYGTYAADRIDYSFYNSMFNQSVMNVDVNTTYDITSSTWSFATNALTTAFPAGFGWALGFDNAAEGKSIRLPKKDNEYHYFRNDAWLGMSETITRDANYGKAAFNGDVTLTLTQNADGNVFLLGNPTFAYIDLLALKNENSNITGVFYLSGLDKGSRYDHVTGQALADDWYTTDGTVTDNLLAPMHAVLVVKKGDAAKTLDITISKDMLVTKNGSKEGNIVKATSAPRRAAALSAEKAIYIKAETERFTSTALLLEDADASDAYNQEEDAEVFLLDRSKTPFAIYTVADNKALAINRISDLDVVPLGFYAQNENESEEVSFTGNDAYLSEWDLVDNTTGNRETLYDGFTTTLSMNEDGVIRYYLEHARKTYGTATGLDEFSTAINAYSHDGQLTVYSADDMTDFCLYDAAGRLLASSANAGRIQQFNLTTGVYVVRASGNVAKVVVK